MASQAVTKRTRRLAEEFKPKIETPDDYKEVLAQVETGDHRSRLLTILGGRLGEFYRAMQPEHFRRLARVALGAARDAENAPVARIRAVQAILSPIKEAVDVTYRLQRLNCAEPTIVQHMYTLLQAFYDELGDGEFAELGRILVEAGGGLKDTAKVESRIKAIAAALKSLNDGLKLVGKVAEQNHRRRAQADADTGKVAAGAAEHERMVRESQKRIKQKYPRLKLAKVKSKAKAS